MNNKISRRDFLKLSGLAGGGLVVAIYLESCASGTAMPTIVSVTPEETTTPPPLFGWQPAAYIQLDQNDTLTFTAFRSEMGQGIRTALAMLVAEELDVDWSSVRIVQADADSRFWDQHTGGSVSVSTYYSFMRQAGATARQMLVEAAAELWDVDPAQCETDAGFVIHPSREKKSSCGELVEAASKIQSPKQVSPKEPDQFSIFGTKLGHWDAPKIVIGKAIYGLDVRLPGMLFAAIARCPVFDGTFAGYDDSETKAITGVKQVVELGDRIAVVADNSWAQFVDAMPYRSRGMKAAMQRWTVRR